MQTFIYLSDVFLVDIFCLSIFKQVLANRPDIIREDYMNELCILQDDVPSFPNEVCALCLFPVLGEFGTILFL